MLPGLTHNEKRYFLGIANGKITYRPGKDVEKETYDAFEGQLKSITKREATIQGATTVFYDFTLVNGGNTYVLSVQMGGSIARSIILCLASVENIAGAFIKLVPWLKDGQYTNVSVYCNGAKLGWVVEPAKIPKAVETVFKGKKFIDDSDRIEFVDRYVTTINERLSRIVDPETGEVNAPSVDVEMEDMPEDIG